MFTSEVQKILVFSLSFQFVVLEFFSMRPKIILPKLLDAIHNIVVTRWWVVGMS